MALTRRTKIVATLGPATDDRAVLDGMIEAGMDVARLGLAHGPVEDALRRLALVRDAGARAGRHIGVLADLPGPKVRAAPFPEGGIRVEAGQEMRLVEAEPGSRSGQEVVSVDLPGAVGLLRPGDRVALGDGGVALVVEATGGGEARARVLATGRLQGRPGVLLPADRVPLSSPTEDDLVLLAEVVAAGVEAVAVSFVTTPEDVVVVRREAGADPPMIVAKIETAEAVAVLEDILAVSDGVMVARGDLGVRVPLEDVPHLQKRIIRTGVGWARPVITATQMLESMVTAPTPTRAEVTDVANAVFDGTSAVMLSGETAVGHNPVAAVAAMARITERAEQEFNYEGWGARLGRQQAAVLADASAEVRVQSAITAAAWRAIVDVEPAAVIACTRTGSTVRAISRFRPRPPLLAVTPSERTARQLSLVWGARPVVAAEHASTDEIVWHAVEGAARNGYVRAGDIVAVLVGSPSEDRPVTDTLRLVRVR